MSRTLKADLHVHTDGSYDCHTPVEDVVEAAVEAELDVLAVTDHDAIEMSYEAAELVSDYDIVGVVGVEVSTSKGHILALGVEERPPAGEPVDKTVERVRSQGGVAVLPHPFQRLRHGAGAVRDVDAVESYNSRLLTGFANWRAHRFARRHGLPEVGGSDAHIAAMVGQTHTEIEAERDADAVLEAIRDGHTEVYGRRTPFAHTFQQFATKAPARVKRDLLSFFS